MPSRTWRLPPSDFEGLTGSSWNTVIPGLVPGISIPDNTSEAEMAGTSPAMTREMICFRDAASCRLQKI
jgi:hypothetical protein